MKTRIVSLTLLTLTCGSGATLAVDSLKIYNWSEYIAPETVADFARETGIQATYDVYSSNETLDGKLVTGQPGYDVAPPSNHFMAEQVQAGTLRKLDKSQLPNWKNLNPVLLKALEVSDPGNQYGFPYLWDAIGIGYSPTKTKAVLGGDAPPDSRDIFFKPEYTRRLSKRGAAVLDNGPEPLPIALSYLGLPHRSQKAGDYKQAQAALLKVRPYIRYFHSSKYVSDLVNGEICMVVGFSGDILQTVTHTKEANDSVEVRCSTPEKGSPLWLDMASVPIDTPGEKAGCASINYLLRPEVMAAISNHVRYANDNLAAGPLVDAETKADPAIYPPQEEIAKLFALESMPQKIDRVRTRTWDTVKTDK